MKLTPTILAQEWKPVLYICCIRSSSADTNDFSVRVRLLLAVFPITFLSCTFKILAPVSNNIFTTIEGKSKLCTLKIIGRIHVNKNLK